MSSIPRGAIRAAVRRGMTFAAKTQSILAVGIGHKHQGGKYAEIGSLCVRFLVPNKINHPQNPIPTTIAVHYKGQDYTVPTDVEHGGDIVQQSLSCGYSAYPSKKGTVTCFLHNTAGQSYMLTAGHVLDDYSADLRVTIDGKIRGSMVPNLSNIFDQNYYYDVAIAQLDEFNTNWHQMLPWFSMNRIWPQGSLWRYFPNTSNPESRITGMLFGARNSLLVTFDTLFYSTYDYTATLRYAYPLLGYRNRNAMLAPGFSGGAVTDVHGQYLLGVHVLGSSNYGYAQSAELLLAMINQRLPRGLSLLHRPLT